MIGRLEEIGVDWLNMNKNELKKNPVEYNTKTSRRFGYSKFGHEGGKATVYRSETGAGEFFVHIQEGSTEVAVHVDCIDVFYFLCYDTQEPRPKYDEVFTDQEHWMIYASRYDLEDIIPWDDTLYLCRWLWQDDPDKVIPDDPDDDFIVVRKLSEGEEIAAVKVSRRRLYWNQGVEYVFPDDTNLFTYDYDIISCTGLRVLGKIDVTPRNNIQTEALLLFGAAWCDECERYTATNRNDIWKNEILCSHCYEDRIRREWEDIIETMKKKLHDPCYIDTDNDDDDRPKKKKPREEDNYWDGIEKYAEEYEWRRTHFEFDDNDKPLKNKSSSDYNDDLDDLPDIDDLDDDDYFAEAI